MITDKKRNEMFAFKAPINEAKHVGIEIEFASRHEMHSVLELLVERQLDGWVSVGYDGDPPAGHVGYEWKILCTQLEMRSVIPRVCQLIKDIGGFANNSCGLHVHLDMRNRTHRSFGNLVRAQPLLFSIADKRRSDSGWCREVVSTYPHSGMTGKSVAINPLYTRENYSKKTIEVRIREGIVDGVDILYWTRLLVAIADSKELSKPIISAKDLVENVRVSKRMKAYVEERIRKAG